MKNILLLIQVLLISTIKGWRCSVTGYCKNNGGWGPITHACPAECGNGNFCTPGQCNPASGGCSNVVSPTCDTTAVDCTGTLSAIAHSFDRSVPYDGTNSSPQPTNSHWNELFAISNTAYCPILTCDVTGGLHNSIDLHNVKYEGLAKLTYQVDLVYLPEQFKVRCSNSHSANTKLDSVPIQIEVYCPGVGCTNTDAGTFDWPRYALSASNGVWSWKEYTPASLHSSTPDWRNLWNENGYASRDRNYHEFEIRSGQWPYIEFEKFSHKTCSRQCHAYYQYKVMDIDQVTEHTQLEDVWEMTGNSNYDRIRVIESLKLIEETYNFTIRLEGYNNHAYFEYDNNADSTPLKLTSLPQQTDPVMYSNRTFSFRVFCGPNSAQPTHAGNSISPTANSPGTNYIQFVATNDAASGGSPTSSQLTRFMMPAVDTPINACYITTNHSTLWSSGIAGESTTNIDGKYMTNQTYAGVAAPSGDPGGMNDPVCPNAPTNNKTGCYIKPKDITREGIYYFYVSTWTYGTPFGKQTISNRYSLIVGCAWDTNFPMTMLNSGSFVNNFAITVGQTNLDNLYTYHLPQIVDQARRAYCPHLSHTITNIQINYGSGPASTATGVAFHSPGTCTLTIGSPSCPQVSVATSSVEYTITFDFTVVVYRDKVNSPNPLVSSPGTDLSHTSPTVTLTSTCSKTSTAIQTSIVTEYHTYLSSDVHAYEFKATNFTCTYSDCCKQLHFQTVSDPLGTTPHPLLPHPHFNSTTQTWQVLIDTSVIRVTEFYIRAYNSHTQIHLGPGNNGNWDNVNDFDPTFSYGHIVSPIIYADVVSNCNHDNITLNGTADIKIVGYDNFLYQWENDTEFNQPVKRFSVDEESISLYGIDINETRWFQHVSNDSLCPLNNYTIDRVWSNVTGNDIDYQLLLSLDEFGKFQIMNFMEPITNYQLSISVSNGFIRSNGTMNPIWQTTNRVNPPKHGQIFKLSLQSTPKKLLYHSGGLLYMGTGYNQSDASSFKLVPGLVGTSVFGGQQFSFESVDNPGMYLRHQGWVIKLHTNDGSPLFAQDATFTMYWTYDGQRVKFHSYNFPDGLITTDASLKLILVRFASFEVAYEKQDPQVSWFPLLQGSQPQGTYSSVILGPTMNITINEVIPATFVPAVEPIFESNMDLLEKQNATIVLDRFIVFIDLASQNLGFSKFELPRAISPTDLNSPVQISPKTPHNFIAFETSSKSFTFDLTLLNSTSYIWNNFLSQSVFLSDKEFQINGKKEAGREYLSSITLQDLEGLTSTYFLVVRVIDSSPIAFSVDLNQEIINEKYLRDEKFYGEIVELTETGKMTIEFSMPVFPVGDLSFVNQTRYSSDGGVELNGTVDIYIIPANNRQYEDGFELETVNLTWSTVFFEYNKLVVQLEFFEPNQISPKINWDKIAFFVRDEGMPLFKTLFLQKHLTEENRLMVSKVRRQLQNSDEVQNFEALSESVGASLMTLLIISFVLSFILQGSFEYMICLVRYMQIVLHLPMMKVVTPASVILMNRILIAVAMFDMFDPEWTTDYFYGYDQSKVQAFQKLVLDQIQDIGYWTPYIINSMGSISIFTAIYLSKVCIFIVFFLLMKLTPLAYWQRGHEKLKSLSQAVFFSDLFAIIIDAYFEFSICCYFNLTFEIYPEQLDVTLQDQNTTESLPDQTLRQLRSDPIVIPQDYTKWDGVVTSYNFAYVNSILAFAILPLCYVFIFTQSIDTLKSEEFQLRWGNLYWYLKMDSKIRILWYVVFLLRRVVFVAIVFTCKQNQILQFLSVLILNLIMIIIQGKLQAFVDPTLNRLYLFNEFQISLTVVHMLSYSDAVPDLNLQSTYGWSQTFWVYFTILVNLYFILKILVRQYHLILWKAYNYIKFHCCKEKPKHLLCPCCPNNLTLTKISGCPDSYAEPPQCDLCSKPHLCCAPHFYRCLNCTLDLCHSCFSNKLHCNPVNKIVVRTKLMISQNISKEKKESFDDVTLENKTQDAGEIFNQDNQVDHVFRQKNQDGTAFERYLTNVEGIGKKENQVSQQIQEYLKTQRRIKGVEDCELKIEQNEYEDEGQKSYQKKNNFVIYGDEWLEEDDGDQQLDDQQEGQEKGGGQSCQDLNIDPLEAFFQGYGQSKVEPRSEAQVFEEKKIGETSEGEEWDGGQIYLGSKITEISQGKSTQRQLDNKRKNLIKKGMKSLKPLDQSVIKEESAELNESVSSRRDNVGDNEFDLESSSSSEESETRKESGEGDRGKEDDEFVESSYSSDNGKGQDIGGNQPSFVNRYTAKFSNLLGQYQNQQNKSEEHKVEKDHLEIQPASPLNAFKLQSQESHQRGIIKYQTPQNKNTNYKRSHQRSQANTDWRGQLSQVINPDQYDSSGRLKHSEKVDEIRQEPLHMRGRVPDKITPKKEPKNFLKKSEGKIVSNYKVHEQFQRKKQQEFTHQTQLDEEYDPRLGYIPGKKEKYSSRTESGPRYWDHTQSSEKRQARVPSKNLQTILKANDFASQKFNLIKVQNSPKRIPKGPKNKFSHQDYQIQPHQAEEIPLTSDMILDIVPKFKKQVFDEFNSQSIACGVYPSPRSSVEKINMRMIDRLKASDQFRNMSKIDQQIVVIEFQNNFRFSEIEFMEIQEAFFDQMSKDLDRKQKMLI